MLFQLPLPPPQYPVRFEADYPERLSRLSSFFRIILAIPLLILVGFLGGYPAIAGISLGVSFGLISGILLVHWLAVLSAAAPSAGSSLPSLPSSASSSAPTPTCS